MRAELVNLNHCAVPFLSRAAVKLSWYDSCVYCILYSVYCVVYSIHCILHTTDSLWPNGVATRAANPGGIHPPNNFDFSKKKGHQKSFGGNE